MQPSKKTLLYHYTSFQSFCSILNSSNEKAVCLWARNFMGMNDPMDCRYLLYELAKDRCSTKDSQNINKMICQVQENGFYYLGNPYFISLTTKGDDLHMWTEYGDKGFGIALGFELSVGKYDDIRINDGMSQKNKIIYPPKIYKCMYYDGEKIVSLFKKYEDLFAPHKAQEICETACAIKHPCYSMEDEHRMIMFVEKEDVKYNEGRNCIQRHIEVHIPKNKLREIIIGPSLRITPDELSSLLKQKVGWDISSVTVSKIPFCHKE